MPEYGKFCFVEEALPTRAALSFVSKEGKPVDDIAKRKVIAQISGTVALKKISRAEAVDLITEVTEGYVNPGNENVFSAVYNIEERAIDAYMETLAEKVTDGFITTDQFMEEYNLTNRFLIHEEFEIIGLGGLDSVIAADGVITPYFRMIDDSEYESDDCYELKIAKELNLTDEAFQHELKPGTSRFNSGRQHMSLGVTSENGYEPVVTILNENHPSFMYIKS